LGSENGSGPHKDGDAVDRGMEKGDDEMTFATKFDIGDKVRREGKPAFTITQINIQTLKRGALVLIQYRPEYSTGRYGPWRAEKYLEWA